MTANYILWEVHGRSDYSYTATMQQVIIKLWFQICFKFCIAETRKMHRQFLLNDSCSFTSSWRYRNHIKPSTFCRPKCAVNALATLRRRDVCSLSCRYGEVTVPSLYGCSSCIWIIIPTDTCTIHSLTHSKS